MASDVKKPKGILKSSSSFDKPDHPHHNSKEMKWDEMNIMATHHPPGKDYGHMKIDEPKTPYSKLSDAEDDDEEGKRKRSGSVSDEPGVDPETIASRLRKVEENKAVAEEEEESSEEDEDETEEERAKRKMFEQKRKLHYNEFQAVKLAKQLMEEEDEEEEDETTDNSNTEDKNSNDATTSTPI